MPAEVTPPVTDKPRRARKSAPKKPRAPRLTPARTLRVRIAEIGPRHAEAFAMLVKADPPFEASVRDAMDAIENATALGFALAMAKAAAIVAQKNFDEAESGLGSSRATLAVLDEKAAILARFHDDTPDAEDIDAADQHRAEHPEDGVDQNHPDD